MAARATPRDLFRIRLGKCDHLVSSVVSQKKKKHKQSHRLKNAAAIQQTLRIFGQKKKKKCSVHRKGIQFDCTNRDFSYQIFVAMKKKIPAN